MSRLLVMGYGSIGRRHTANAADLAEVAVLEPDAAARAAIPSQLRAFSGLDAALAWGPDGVVVATPHATHVPLARAAVASGAHVLVEKPISHNLQGVEALLAEADAADRRVFVACNMRFHPGVAALKLNLARIGRPLFARAHYGNYLPGMRPKADYRSLYSSRRADGGGVVLDSIHEIDYLMWLFGPVHAVACKAAKLSGLDIDVEDFAGLALTHDTGMVSLIQLDYLRPFKRRGCEIVGEAGALLWESEGKRPESVRAGLYTKDAGRWEPLAEDPDFDANRPYKAMLDRFVQSLDGGGAPLLDGRTALAELKIALAALSDAGQSATPANR